MQTRARGRSALLAATWFTAISAGFWFSTTFRIGPIVYQLSQRHGVHLGDLYACAVCFVVAVLITVGLLRRPAGRAAAGSSVARDQLAADPG